MIVSMSGMAEFGALIKRARERKGLTGAELATRLGRPHPFVVRIETAKNSNPPDPQTFADLARVLGLSETEMLEALGYLSRELPGDVVTVAADDPRAEIVRLLAEVDDASVHQIVATIRTLLPLLRGAAEGESRRQTS